jgi:hypothetical protein
MCPSSLGDLRCYYLVILKVEVFSDQGQMKQMTTQVQLSGEYRLKCRDLSHVPIR